MRLVSTNSLNEVRKIITVNRLLKGLEKHNIKLVSGKGGVEKPLEYINIQEFALKSNRIKENGVIMTTFASFHDLHSTIEHLQWLLSKGISAVGIHSVFIKKIPEEIIDFSNNNNFPLFMIPEEVSYQSIMQLYNEILIEDTNVVQLKLEQINLNMLRAVALDKGPQYITSTLGNYLDLPVVHFDKSLHVKSIWTNNKFNRKEIQKLVKEIISEQEDLSVEITTGYVLSGKEDDRLSFKLLPIVEGMNFYGVLIIGMEKDFSLSDKSVVNYGKTALLLDSVKRNSMDKYLKNKDMKIIESILEQANKKTSNFYDLSSYIKNSNQVYLIDLNEFDKLNDSFDLIHQKINKWDPNSLIWLYEHHIICVVEDKMPSNLLVSLSKIYSSFTCGISESSKNINQESILEKYEQANLAVEIGKARGTKFNDWENLGYDKFLFALKQKKIIRDSTINLLEPLIKHDNKLHSELLTTLSIYLNTYFSLKKSAEKLYVHKNTVKYRIDKVKEIYKDIDFEDPEIHLLFLTSLKLYAIESKR